MGVACKWSTPWLPGTSRARAAGGGSSRSAGASRSCAQSAADVRPTTTSGPPAPASNIWCGRCASPEPCLVSAVSALDSYAKGWACGAGLRGVVAGQHGLELTASRGSLSLIQFAISTWPGSWNCWLRRTAQSCRRIGGAHDMVVQCPPQRAGGRVRRCGYGLCSPSRSVGSAPCSDSTATQCACTPSCACRMRHGLPLSSNRHRQMPSVLRMSCDRDSPHSRRAAQRTAPHDPIQHAADANAAMQTHGAHLALEGKLGFEPRHARLRHHRQHEDADRV